MLEDTDTLLSLAEIGATFAGFAALVSALANRTGRAQTLHDVLRLRLVIAVSIIVVAVSLVPVAVANFEVEADVGWRVSALLFLVLTYGAVWSFMRSYQPVRGEFAPDVSAVLVAALLEIFIQGALWILVSGVWPERDYALYVSAIVCTLAQGAFVFMRLVGSAFSPQELQ